MEEFYYVNDQLCCYAYPFYFVYCLKNIFVFYTENRKYETYLFIFDK